VRYTQRIFRGVLREIPENAERGDGGGISKECVLRRNGEKTLGREEAFGFSRNMINRNLGPICVNRTEQSHRRGGEIERGVC